GNKLGGTGNGNGNFTGQVYTIDRSAPSVTINQKLGQADPTNALPIEFTVVFSESVTGFTGSDVSLSGAAGATATVTGSGTTYNVSVSGITADGTLVATVPVGGASDAAGNTNAASTSADNSVLYDTVNPVSSASGPNQVTNTSPFAVNYTASD